MKSAIFLRNSIESFLYQQLAKPLFFLAKPEAIHRQMIGFGKSLGAHRFGQALTAAFFNFKDSSLEQNILGIHFSNPIGLAAGFDKNGALTSILGSVGFGFMEIGSVTGEQCDGNEGERLWRLKKDKSLIVNYGLANDGAEAIAKRVAISYKSIPVGISIAATNSQKTADELGAIRDFTKAYAIFARENIGDYFTINISCPNAFGGETFLKADRLEHLLKTITEAKKLYHSTKPIFLKLAANLNEQELDDIIVVARRYTIHGFICSNLQKQRPAHLQDKPSGGLSGLPVQKISTDLIRSIYKKTKGEFIIIGVGGIFSAADAYEKIKAGATLLQLITGMIYNGPQLISEINAGLVELLKADGYTHINQAIGKDSIYNNS